MNESMFTLIQNQEKILQEVTALRDESNSLKMAINEVNHQVDDLCKFIKKL
jgi:hypothetical protein